MALVFEEGELCFAVSHDAFGDAGFVAHFSGVIKDASLESVREILLCHPVVSVCVGIEVAFSVSEPVFVSRGVLERVWDIVGVFFLDDGEGVKESHGGVGFWGGGQIEGGVGQVVSSFWESDTVKCGGA